MFNSKEENIIWNAALYVRLSQDDKDKNVSNSIINQEKMLSDYVIKNKKEQFNIVDSYIDDGYTGTNFNRPAFKRMMNDIKAGIVNCIIVKDLSRFGREHIDVDNYLERILPLLGVRFISVMQNIDSFKNPEKMNSIEIPFLNLINEEYARDISRKTKASLETKRKEGKYVYSRAPYGYLKDPDDKYHLIVDKAKAENVRKVFRLYIKGISIYSIYKDMKKKSVKNFEEETWSVVKVKRILNNMIYTGDMVQGTTSKYNHKTKKRFELPEKDWIVVPDTHEAIIEKEIFEVAHMQLQTCSKPKLEKESSIFAQYLRCEDCSQKMVRTSATVKGKVYRRFICSTYKKFGKNACSSHIIDEDALKVIVLTIIQDQIRCVLDIEKIVRRTKNEIINKRKQLYHSKKIDHLENELLKRKSISRGLYEDYKVGIITLDEYEEMKDAYKNSVYNIEEEIKEQNKIIKAFDTNDILKNRYINSFKQYKNISELSREILLNLVEEIIVFRDKKIKIVFKFEDEYKKLVPIFDLE